MKNEIIYSNLKIPRGKFPDIEIPQIVINSHKKGPVVWITASSHGDEVTGIVIIHKIIKLIKRKGCLKKGSLNLLPLMNPEGFEAGSREIPSTKEDLNRSFPGDKDGSLGEKMAYSIFSELKKTKPSFALDLHNDCKFSVPYILLDDIKGKIILKSEKIAKKSGLIIVSEKIKNEEEEKTFSYNLVKTGIPSFTLELGESKTTNEYNIKMGIQTIWNILSYLQMVKKSKIKDYDIPKEIKDKELIYSEKPLSSKKGIVRFIVKPGDIIGKGEKFAEIYDYYGKLQEELFAEERGIVLGSYSDNILIKPKSPLMAFGLIK